VRLVSQFLLPPNPTPAVSIPVLLRLFKSATSAVYEGYGQSYGNGKGNENFAMKKIDAGKKTFENR